jgi:hypothetical protein
MHMPPKGEYLRDGNRRRKGKEKKREKRKGDAALLLV